MTGQEGYGHLDVKIPSKGRKFGLWKAWRRQWCVLQRHGGALLQLAIGNSPHSGADCGLVVIPHDAVLCRSESRSRQFAFGIFSRSGCGLRRPILFLSGRSEADSQRWMMRIRNLISPPIIPAGGDGSGWSVSLVDNGHSRAAGLAGLYGSLRLSTAGGVTVTDPATGQRRSHWPWPQLASVASVTAEDAGRVIVITTSSEFSSGEGELWLYCAEGDRALESALSAHCHHRPTAAAKPAVRPRDSPLPPLPSASMLATRRLSRSEGDLRLWSFHHPPFDAPPFHPRTQSHTRTSHDKVASGMIGAGLGLMLTTPGCSEPDSLHDYQCLDSLWSQREQERERDVLPPLREFAARHQAYDSTKRRESGVSVASGIYEEIAEQLDESYEPSPPPPPLPPRLPETDVADEALVYSVPNEDEEPLYLPMAPRGGSLENAYVAMANLINNNTYISEPVV